MFLKPKWVVFDVGGVIFDYKGSIKDIANHTGLKEQSISDIFTEFIVDGELGRVYLEDVWAELVKRHKLNHDPQDLFNLWWGEKRYVTDTRLLLRQLHKAGYQITTFTNTWIGMVERNQKELKEYKLVKGIYSSIEYKMRKPDIKFYHLVEESINAKSQEIFFIDDSKPNIETALSRNWQTFHYNIEPDNGKTSNDKIREYLLNNLA